MEFDAARQGPLFETPVAHFLLRAFLSDGIDEVIAHMTAIEAAVGLEMDHKAKLRPKPDLHKGLSATKRVAARIGGMLNDGSAARDYQELFELRSTFIHGRAGLQKISTAKRVMARSIARRVTAGLINLSHQTARPRSDVLTDLLDHGAQYL
ncbi:hypothetical protein [Sphingobium sp.]|uniref:hypothetical protein n=1 Tax=Sphingobium sp. TaxID=1912891 RepID=UPI002B5E2618|nr:hypothetical protein [Sphingobium sp.]HUD91621.1 hypothetical protein [Sphingobium sp.]